LRRLQFSKQNLLSGWEPAANAFEFSITEVDLRALEIDPDLFDEWAIPNLAAEEDAA
jgi:hypothetical protein